MRDQVILACTECKRRNYTATKLRINRIFEHGEVLAFIRFFTSRLVPDGDFPVKWEYRYNFDPKANIVRNHSMRSLACGLYRAAHDAPASRLGKAN